jgi:hypothetical protein
MTILPEPSRPDLILKILSIPFFLYRQAEPTINKVIFAEILHA